LAYLEAIHNSANDPRDAQRCAIYFSLLREKVGCFSSNLSMMSTQPEESRHRPATDSFVAVRAGLFFRVAAPDDTDGSPVKGVKERSLHSTDTCTPLRLARARNGYRKTGMRGMRYPPFRLCGWFAGLSWCCARCDPTLRVNSLPDSVIRNWLTRSAWPLVEMQSDGTALYCSPTRICPMLGPALRLNASALPSCSV
jgi:hypothetical protein